MGYILEKLKGKRRYWWCWHCGGTKNWLDRKTKFDVCRKCGAPIGKEKIKPLTEKEKEAIRERDGRRCLLCRRLIKYHRHQHVHHLKARHFGGTNEPRNLVLLCERCHRRLTPGWQEALDAYRSGNKQAFREWQEEKAYQLRQYEPKQRDSNLIIWVRVQEREDRGEGRH